MSEEKRNDSAGRLVSAIALPEWSLRRKLALVLMIPMLLAATFGGLRVHGELARSDSYSATAKQVIVLRPAAAYLAAAETAIIVSRQQPTLDDPARVAAIEAVEAAAVTLEERAASADLTQAQQQRLDSVLQLSGQLRDGSAYLSTGQAVSQLRQLQRGVTSLIDAIVAAQSEPEPKLVALQQALDGRVSLAMQQYMVSISDKSLVNSVDLAAELGVEQVIIDRLASFLGTEDPQVQQLNQQNAAHFGVVRAGTFDLGDASAFAAYDELTTGLLDRLDTDLTSAARDARRLAIANAVVTVAALLAALFLALLISRMLLHPIRRVREGALEIANQRLPEMVARIRRGEDPGEITPIPVTTHEEMGQLARAVDDMNRQAVHLASGEARLRSQVGDMFSTLSRRNTSLINQQLGLIERLEKDEEDPNRLESLFRLDHLASRMRRTADSLMVLADAPVPTSDTAALPLGDVLQAAMAGVQEYQRVQIESAPTDPVNGAAATDLVHLMTELVDNALAFSPPTAPVKVSTKRAGDSIIVEISDGGLGIAPDVLDSLNEDLRSGGEVTVETARRMGLLVVSRLAERHGLTVSLARNARGGTTATVLVPPALLRGRRSTTQAETLPDLDGVPSVPGDVQVAPVAPAPVAAPVAAPVVASTAPVAEPKLPVVAQVDEPAVRPAAPAARAATAAMPATETPDSGVDSIAAAINAVTRLPQRSPGATRSGSAMPGAPIASGGGSLFQRLQAKAQAAEEEAALATAGQSTSEPTTSPTSPTSLAAEDGDHGTTTAAALERTQTGLPQRARTAPTSAFAAIDVALVGLTPAAPAGLEKDHGERAEPGEVTLGDAEAPDALPPVTPGPLARRGLSNFHALNQSAPRSDGNADSVDPEPLEADAEPSEVAEVDLEPVEGDEELVEADEVSTSGWLSADQTTVVATPPTTPYDLLDSRRPAPESTEDETPIFLTLRSNWLSSGRTGGTWATSEIEAGWEAAEQVAEAPALQVSESGLPMRRPGKRLVPGGVSPLPTDVTRDPEAVRARLAAHAAGVSRGRTAAVEHPLPGPSTVTEEGPA